MSDQEMEQSQLVLAEALRLNAQRLDAVLADRESERAARIAAERRAEVAEDTIEQVKALRNMAPDGAQGPTWAALYIALRNNPDRLKGSS